MRVRHGTRKRVATGSAARGVGGGEAGEGKRQKKGARRRGTAQWWGARPRPLVAGGENVREGLAAHPSLGEARAPAARACAARRPRERALTQVRALAISATHQLQHQQQRRRRRRRRPPSAAATTATFSSLSSTVLALCRLSGKREAPKCASSSAPLHPQAAAPRPPLQRWVS